MNPELWAHLLRLELALVTRDPTGIEGGLMSLIAPDFLEFGRSGRVWTRDSIRDVLEGTSSSPVSVEQVADRFDVAELADGVALVTYRAPNANRCSIWVRAESGWQIRFHQGTAIRDEPAQVRRAGGIGRGLRRAEQSRDQATGDERQAE